MEVGRAPAGCKPARFGARNNADATSIGMGCGHRIAWFSLGGPHGLSSTTGS
ncbi:MAG: hypothetical protein AB7V62_01970 [Thermoleophilia bacterium]